MVGALCATALGAAASAQGGPLPDRARTAGPAPGGTAAALTCAVFADASAFDAAFPGLAREDFEDANATAPVILCNGPVDADGDGGTCFDAGDIEVGMEIDNPHPAEVQFALFNEFAGLVGIAVGPVFPSGNGEIRFRFDPPVGQVGFDFSSPVALDARIRVYAPDGSLVFLQSPSSAGFFGYSCGARIESVEVQLSTIGGPALDNIRFGTLQPELGARHCSPNLPNSTGGGGTMLVTGSDSVADDDLTLTALDLPPQPNIGYFIMGTGTNTFIPSGAGSFLCVTPGLERFLPPVESTAELGGGFARRVGTTGPISSDITAGSTWSFQAWHRDDAAGTSHFTDAVSVTFQ